MKLETPFTGKLAVLGVRGRLPHVLRVDGNWELRPGAVVYHQTRIGELEFGSPSVIGEIQRLVTYHTNDGEPPFLTAEGLGTTWLAEILDAGTHALSMEMDLMTVAGCSHPANINIVAGRVVGAMLVRADAFGWTGVR